VEELISIAVLVATLYGGTLATEKIYTAVRDVALTKAAEGLPKLAPFAESLTRSRGQTHFLAKPSAAHTN